MEISKIQTDNTITLRISGKLSAATAEEFGKAVDAAIDESTRLVMDFQGVTYLASAGLRVLISAQKKLTALDGSFSLCNVGETILEVFEITGLDDIFDIQ
ncbi:MAG: STAS domain-containing protein [Treponema sp.]|jgi:anti-sigma B factor antagonist|nr:STAS domain-containing protein [Treponema sp.]